MQQPQPLHVAHSDPSMPHHPPLASLFSCTSFGIFCSTCQVPIDFEVDAVVNHCRHHHHHAIPLPAVRDFMFHTQHKMTFLSHQYPMTTFLRSPSIHLVGMCRYCGTISPQPCGCGRGATTPVQAYTTVCGRYVRADMVQQQFLRLPPHQQQQEWQRLKQQPQQETSIVEQKIVVVPKTTTEDQIQQETTTTTTAGVPGRRVEKVITVDELMQMKLPLKERVFVAL